MKVALLATLAVASPAWALQVKSVKGDLSKLPVAAALWSGVASEKIEMMAQPTVVPRPKVTTTAKITVQAVQDGKWIAFRLEWPDSEASSGGKLGKYSDGVAMEFPVKNNPEDPPSVMMGHKDNPVHVIHWKAQFQKDMETGRVAGVKDHYPNLNVDMYPMDYHNEGKYPVKFTQDMKDTYVHGRAAGNVQSSPKLQGVDEIVAEGFGTSQVIEKTLAWGKGEYKNGKWSVVITRPLSGASTLQPGKENMIAFAVWQGGKDEVGARKSVTMNWTPLTWDTK